MDPLPMVAVVSMADVDRHAEEYPSSMLQLFVNPETPLAEALAMDSRMRADRPGIGHGLFNPEVIRLKVQAEAAAQAAVQRANESVARAEARLETTRANVEKLQALIAAGDDEVRVGPSINRRAVQFERVIFATGKDIPAHQVLLPRKLSKKQKLRSRRSDAMSQMAFWKINLEALRSKEAAQVAYLEQLVMVASSLGNKMLHERTFIGCGYSDYRFLY